ncbi:putative bifunctional diguanylate cyclase/phosphodiesterase [Actinoplanes sp. GCM10030250]|uniref:putative bifunctional diguanylate cyclase/phosphodiesterase n=1 Tax=Actinoplanes sp. GCM10030250 TaxID=3273376 RepID=UPI003617CBBF
MWDDVALPPVRTARWAAAAWILMGAGIPAAVFVGAAAPATASSAYVIGVLVCVVAGIAGVRGNVAAGHRRPWILILAAQSLSLVGESVRLLVTSVDGPAHTVLAAIPNAVVLPNYLLLIAGVLDLLRRSRAADDDPARVDAVLIGVGAAIVVWSLWMEPWFAGDDPRWQNLVAAALPLAGGLLLIIALPMLLLGRTGAPALWFFTISGVALLAGNMVLATRGWFASGPDSIPLNVMGAVVLIADAANAACLLHPTVRVLTQRVRARSWQLRTGRTAAIAAALCVPTVLSVAVPPAGRPFTLVRAALSLALIGAVVARVVRANNSRARAEQEARWRAEHDPLTGLPNRETLAAAVEAWAAEPGQPRVSVLLIDLDRFKLINDHWGHEVGDELLRAVAARIAAAVRTEDVVCRVGGDEFMVALPGAAALPGPAALPAPVGEGPAGEGPDAEATAERLLTVLAAPLPLSVGAVDVTASIGIAHAHGSWSAVELFRDADTAMYRAKDSGRNRFAVFDPALRERIRRRFSLERAFRGAGTRGELAVHYQPLVHLATEQVDGFEALMRWTHPELGAVSPVEFIPVAEDTGMIVSAGAWLLEEAAAQTQAWRTARPPGLPLHVSVNLAVRQLREPDLVDRVRDILARTALPPEGLWLEVTESGFMADPETCLTALHQLKDLGITLCIDDFGTGYSSLSYLQQLPVAIVKIDRAFISGVGNGGPNEPIVRAVLAMSHALGHRVVAEGVETTVQRDWLRSSGCDFGQGWLYGKPLPAAQQDAARPRAGLLNR